MPVPVTRHVFKRWGPLFLKLGIAGGLLAFVFSRVDLAKVSGILLAADPAMIAMSVVLASLNYPLGGVRWWCVVRALGDRASPRLLTGLFWLGGLVGQVVPNPMGDAVRISAAARLGLGLGTAFRSAFLERVAMLAGLALLIAATQPLLHARVGAADPAWLAISLCAIGLCGLTMLATADHLLMRLRHLRAIAALANLSAAFRRLAASRWAWPMLVTVLMSHLNAVAVAVVLGAALGLPLGMNDYLATVPVAILAVVLPVSVGGWGVREGVLLALLGAMGVRAESALAFSLMLGMVGMVAALPGVATLFQSAGERAKPQ